MECNWPSLWQPGVAQSSLLAGLTNLDCWVGASITCSSWKTDVWSAADHFRLMLLTSVPLFLASRFINGECDGLIQDQATNTGRGTISVWTMKRWKWVIWEEVNIPTPGADGEWNSINNWNISKFCVISSTRSGLGFSLLRVLGQLQSREILFSFSILNQFVTSYLSQYSHGNDKYLSGKHKHSWQ
jgi:hypothetical protein